MADFDLELEGLQNVIESLNDLEADLDSDQTFLVGTAVEYAIYLELGTSDMDPKPFFRPALGELRAKGVEAFVAEHNRTTVGALDNIDQVVAAVALTLERRIKEIIRDKGLIDTGTLRASIVAARSSDPSILPGADEFSGFTSDSPAPPSAGRSLVSESITIDT